MPRKHGTLTKAGKVRFFYIVLIENRLKNLLLKSKNKKELKKSLKEEPIKNYFMLEDMWMLKN